MQSLSPPSKTHDDYLEYKKLQFTDLQKFDQFIRK